MTSPGGTLTERLQLVVDATTNQAEARFSKLTGAARETGDAAVRTSNSVRDAADRVAAARDRELTAAGNLRVAETRLEQMRTSGRARADQLAAAEERVATAQRTLQLSMRNTERAQQDLSATQRQATTQMEHTERSGGRLQEKLGEVRGEALALGAAGLGAIIRGIGDGFADSARDAGLLATSMNATAEEAGAFLGLVGTLGLDLNDLLEIQAEFAQKTRDGLTLVGTELAKNADGTVNWSTTLVDALAELQRIPDATERNRQGFAMFGEEGYKQLSRLVASGVDVQDALARIGTPITQEDIDAAADYDAAMMDLTLTSTQTQQALGRLLLPVLTGLAEGLGDVVDVVEEIPAPLGIATAAAIALGVTGWNPAAAAGGRLSVIMAAVNRNLATYNGVAALAGRTSATLGVTMGLAGTGARGLMGLLGGPLGVTMIAGAALWSEMSAGADRFRESAHDAAVELSETDHAIRASDGAVQDHARALAEEADTWQVLAATMRGVAAQREDMDAGNRSFAETAGLFGATGTAVTLALSDEDAAARGFSEAIEDAAEELGAFGAQQQTAQVATRTLSDLIAEGSTSGRQFADAVRDAAEAEAAQTRTSDLAKAAVDAYNASTRDAVQTQLEMFQATLQQRDGVIGLQQAVWETRDVVDDASTPWNEVDEAVNRVIGTVLDYAGTSADAAVATAKAQGEVVDSLAEARIRGDATVKAMRDALNAPGLTEGARLQMESLIGRLEDAQKSGDIEAVLRLTGADETASELDDATQDRETTVRVETRNGPAVKRYLEGITDARRLALVRVESRNGPAVDRYLDGLAHQRLALIRVETRNGPAVDAYLDRLAEQARTAYIDVRDRGSAAAGGGPGLRGAPGAYAAGAAYGSGDTIVERMTVVVQADAGGRLTQPSLAEAGRQVARQLAAHERTSGAGWRTRGRAG